MQNICKYQLKYVATDNGLIKAGLVFILAIESHSLTKIFSVFNYNASAVIIYRVIHMLCMSARQKMLQFLNAMKF